MGGETVSDDSDMTKLVVLTDKNGSQEVQIEKNIPLIIGFKSWH